VGGYYRDRTRQEAESERYKDVLERVPVVTPRPSARPVNAEPRTAALHNMVVKLRESRPVSRVLSWAIIHLGLLSPASSSDLPEDIAGRDIAFLFGLAPGGVYHATNCYQLRGALLPHHFTLTCKAGGLFSAALSVGSRPPGITWHPALWSPDFPPFRLIAKARLPGRLSWLLSSTLNLNDSAYAEKLTNAIRSLAAGITAYLPCVI